MPIPKDIARGIRLLIFDLDGTLADTKLDLALSVNAMREQLALRPLPPEVIAAYIGHGVTNLVRRALGEQGTEEGVQQGLALFLEHYRHHLLDNTVVYPGVSEALEELQNCALAVLTNKPDDFSRAILAGLGIAHYFAFIYGGNSFQQKKPDPVGIQKLMSETGASPEQTLMVGDSDTDVLTGRNAGVWTCGVTYGFGAPTLASAPPDLLIGDLRELPPLLENSRQKAEGSRQTGGSR
jgi:phosphoglycolate phosphatase